MGAKMKIAVEQISKYHPDKYADAISDCIMRNILTEDESALCGIETMVKNDSVIVGGEISTALLDAEIRKIAERSIKEVARELNYEVHDTLILLGTQSPQINKAVLGDDIGAGDQGIVVGYANRAEIDVNNNPYVAKLLADAIIREIESNVEQDGRVLKGDAKCQVMYDTTKEEVAEIVVSACQHSNTRFDELLATIQRIIIDVTNTYKEWYPKLFKNTQVTINPAGKWTIGGPIADCGITGRKLVCDFYGPQLPIGGGAQSGKDLTKVDRSAAIVARYIALDLLRKYEFLPDIKVEISYAIGVSKPTSVNVIGNNVDLYELAVRVQRDYDLTPAGLIKFIKDKNINIYERVGYLR